MYPKAQKSWLWQHSMEKVMKNAVRILGGVKVALFPPDLTASEGVQHLALHSSLSWGVRSFYLHFHCQFSSWGSASEV